MGAVNGPETAAGATEFPQTVSLLVTKSVQLVVINIASMWLAPQIILKRLYNPTPPARLTIIGSSNIFPFFIIIISGQKADDFDVIDCCRVYGRRCNQIVCGSDQCTLCDYLSIYNVST